jgi:DNA-binding LacI/PurR family transcriptional regulator
MLSESPFTIFIIIVEITALEKLKSIVIPVIWIARELQNRSINYVCTNNKDAAFKANRELIKTGHKKNRSPDGSQTFYASGE